jgi:hypothetical protein
MKRFAIQALEYAVGIIIGGIFVLGMIFITGDNVSWCESMGYVLQSIGE